MQTSIESTTRETLHRRRGTTLLELVAAGALLAVLLVVCAQMLNRTVVQRRAIANRRAALQMASNAMERAHQLPWIELDAEAGREIADSVLEQGMLRGSLLEVAVDETKSRLSAKRIRVLVTWNEGTDRVARTQQLTAWRYQVEPGTGADPESTEPSSSTEEEP